MPEKDSDTEKRTESSAKKGIRNVQLEEFLREKEKTGPIPGKVKDLFRARAAASTDYQSIWEGLWR